MNESDLAFHREVFMNHLLHGSRVARQFLISRDWTVYIAVRP